MKFLTTLLFLPLLFPSTSRGFSLLVGNAGEGILENGHVYLRDLYEADLHLDPYVGDHTDREILHRMEGFNPLNVSHSLLARKLSDLNQASPNLGVYVLTVMKHYQWVLMTEPLLPFPEEGSSIDLKTKIPLANRYRTTIRIQQKSWEKMPEPHRVALLIHEALSSLKKLRCEREFCFQDASAVREMIARLFSKSQYQNSNFASWLTSRLNIPSITHGLSCYVGRSHINFINSTGNTISFFVSDKSKDVQNRYVTRLCTEKSGDFEIFMARDSFLLKETPYKTEINGHSFYQQEVALVAVPSGFGMRVRKEAFPDKNSLKCIPSLNSFIEDWFNYKPWTLQGNSMNSGCYYSEYLH